METSVEEGDGGRADAAAGSERISRGKGAKFCASVPFKHPDALKLRKLIQQAEEKPSTQEVQCGGKMIRQTDLLAAIREKGMDDGNIVWNQVAAAMGMDIKRHHNLAAKLLRVLEGRVGPSNARNSEKGDKKRGSKLSLRKAHASKGTSKRAEFKPRPLGSPGSECMLKSTAFSKARHTPAGAYVTIRLPTGESNGTRNEFTHFLPASKESKSKVPREGGLLSRKYLVRRAASLAQRLWVQTLLHSVKRSDTIQDRLRRGQMAKLTRVGWDKMKLGRLIEAAAVGLGVFFWSQTQLCYANPRPEKLSKLGVLSSDSERLLRRSLAQVNRDINKDPRLCCLCRIVGDIGIQGRLLYVERDKWAHVNCICWSKGVYELTIPRNAGKIGMLCNVHSVVHQACHKFCDFCGCPGATVACAAAGCGAMCHFGCAVLDEWKFFAGGRSFCGCCELSLPQGRAWAPIHLYNLTARHLRVLPPRATTKADKGSVHAKAVACGLAGAGPLRRPEDAMAEGGQSSLGALSVHATALNTAAPAALLEQIAPGHPACAGWGALAEKQYWRHWGEFKDSNTGRTFYHNYATKESVWEKPFGAGTTGSDPYSRLKAAIEDGQFDSITLRRLGTISTFLHGAQKARRITIDVAPAPEDNCILGWSSFGVKEEEEVFWNLLGRMFASDDSTWLESGAKTIDRDTQHSHGRAVAILTDLLKKIQVSPASSTKFWRFDKAEHVCETQSAATLPSQQQAFHATAAREKAREAGDTAAEAPQRECEGTLDCEQGGPYENNLLAKIARGMQEGSIMARIGSLTVRCLGKIRVDNDSFHCETSIYPQGYSSSRISFAPGEVLSKGGGRRAMYSCKILAAELGTRPLFQVTVDNAQFLGFTASEAWESATRRSLRYRLSLIYSGIFVS